MIGPGQRGSNLSVKSKLIRNTLANYILGAWSFIVTFIILYLVLVGFGPLKPIGGEDYGIYLLIGALVGYVGLIDLGIGHSLIKFVAEYHAKGEKEKVNEIVNSAFYIFLGIGAIGAIALFIMGTFFLEIFNFQDSDQLIKARKITYIIAVIFTTNFSISVFRDILRGLQKYVLLAYITFFVTLVNLAVIAYVLVMGYGIVEFILLTFIFNLIGPVIMAFYVKRELPYLEIKRKHFQMKTVKTLFSLSMLLFLLFIFNKIIFFTDNIVIGWWFVGTGMVTFYVAARKIYTIPANAVNIALRATIPAASELDALQKKKELQMMLIRLSKYILALLFLVGLPTIFMSRYVLQFWLGEEYAVYYIVANILTLALFFEYFNDISAQILLGMNRMKFLVACYGIIAVLNLVLSLILVREMGLEGVAWGTTIPFIIMTLPLMWNSFRIIGIDWKVYIKESLGKNVPFALCMAGVLYLLLLFHTPANLIEVGIYYIASMAVFFVLFYFIALNKEERDDLKSIFSILKPKDIEVET
jgi:O-antigen/teichoic acid export membrane protein